MVSFWFYASVSTRRLSGAFQVIRGKQEAAFSLVHESGGKTGQEEDGEQRSRGNMIPGASDTPIP